MADNKSPTADIVRGEFLTDGKTFVFRLKDLPISGVGPSADAAFQDLMRAEAGCEDIAPQLKAMAADQAGETVRAGLVRWSLIALLLLGAVGGALAGGLALVPEVAASISTADLGVHDQAAPPTGVK